MTLLGTTDKGVDGGGGGGEGSDLRTGRDGIGREGGGGGGGGRGGDEGGGDVAGVARGPATGAGI